MDSKQYWAKTNPWQSIETHALISGHVAQVLFDHYLSKGAKKLFEHSLNIDEISLREFLGYFVSLHDIGKIEYNFQSKDSKMKELLDHSSENRKEFFDQNVRHEKTGESCVKEIWNLEGNLNPITRIMAKAIGAHHPGRSGNDGFNKDSVWFERQTHFETLMKKHFLKNNYFSSLKITTENKGVIGALLLSVLIFSDWISSCSAFYDSEDWIDQDEPENQIMTKANQFLDRTGLKPCNISWPNSFSQLWTQFSYDQQRPLQTETESVFKHASKRIKLILLEAPMGEGKTEAGIFAALNMAVQWKKDGFYMALPTAATANQMIERVRDLFMEHKIDSRIRLLHSMSWLDDAEEIFSSGDELANWLAPVRRGLLGQYAVGTVDQVMLAATTVKFGALRLLGLSNKVLIIDEIHSYDAYMSEILHRLLEWCNALEIPVVMLSATLPPQKKQDLFSSYTNKTLSHGYPLITTILEDNSVSEKEVAGTVHKMTVNVTTYPILENLNKIVDVAISYVRDGGCLCILMNTVREAQNLYSILKEQWDGDTLLFHAQFPAQRRKILEKECIKRYGKDKSFRPFRSILVATQVVEQSLDVDFDVMLSAIAPIDLLLQRLGRVHRHENTKRPRNLKEPLFGVIVPDNDNSYGLSSYVYPTCLLKSSIRTLKEFQRIRIPEDISEIVRNGYASDKVPPDELKNWLDTISKETLLADASQEFIINSPVKQYRALTEDSIYDDQNGKLSVKTRLGEPTVRIALLEDDDFNKLYQYLNKNSDTTGKFAPVCLKSIAEMVMRNSLSISLKLYMSGISDECDYIGKKLLSGVRIIHVKNGTRTLSDGRIISNDYELGFTIRKC